MLCERYVTLKIILCINMIPCFVYFLGIPVEPMVRVRDIVVETIRHLIIICDTLARVRDIVVETIRHLIIIICDTLARVRT